MGMKIKGLNEFKDKINELERKVDRLSGERQVSFDELFNDGFMKKYTKYNKFSELLDNSGFKVENQDDFKAIPDAEWEKYIISVTKFESWQDMLQIAGAEYYKKQLGF